MTARRLYACGLLLAGGLAVFAGLPHPSLAQEETVVEVTTPAELDAYYRSIDFYDIDNHPERLQAVPCTSFDRVPESQSDQWREDVTLRKSLFFRLAISGVLQVNNMILADRARLLDLDPEDLAVDDASWLTALAERYRVAEAGDPITADRLEALKLRVDALPPSLVMAQGAIESGWLQSRFARQGQAIFGQWTTSESGIKAENSDVRLAAFDNPRDSLIAYMLNLNTHGAYRGLRLERAEMRRNGEPIDGHALAGHMGSYAETGQEYIDLIRGMIRRDDLGRADTATLGDGPCVVFRRVDAE